MKRNCDICGTIYEAKRQTSKFCSNTCRQRNHLGVKPLVKGPPTIAEGSSDHLTYTMVWDELGKAGRVDTYLGAAALQLARRIDGATAVMGFAALVKELRATMEAATAGANVVADPVDELRLRRDRLRAG